MRTDDILWGTGAFCNTNALIVSVTGGKKGRFQGSADDKPVGAQRFRKYCLLINISTDGGRGVGYGRFSLASTQRPGENVSAVNISSTLFE